MGFSSGIRAIDEEYDTAYLDLKPQSNIVKIDRNLKVLLKGLKLSSVTGS